MKIVVGQGSCGIATGAKKVANRFEEILGEKNIDINVDITGCIGTCFLEPIVDIYEDGKDEPTRYVKVKPEDVVEIIESHIEGGKAVESKEISEENKKLVRVTKECVDLALAATKPWGTMGDMGYVCNKHAVENGYSVVREIGGHGCGVQFHEEPWVNHIGEPDEGILFVPGMTFTIEPMVNMGKPDVWEDEDDGWTIRTEDGKPSAQWEYTILVTEDGTEILSH